MMTTLKPSRGRIGQGAAVLWVGLAGATVAWAHPTGGDGAAATDEDVAYRFAVSDFPFQSAHGDEFAGIRIEALPGVGALLVGGERAAAGGVVEDVTSLVFTPEANASGAPYATFSYRVRDQFGDLSGAAYAFRITVNPVPDAPLGGDALITLEEDVAYTFRRANFPFNDLDGEGLAGVHLVALPERGVLEVGGAPAAVGSLVRVDQFGSFVYRPAPDHFGDPAASFRYRVRDTGGGTSEAAYTMALVVVPVNDRPVLDLNGPGDGIDGPGATWIEGLGAAEILGPAATLGDTEGDGISQAVVTLLNPSAGDRLEAGAEAAGISAAYDPASYTLTLSGSADTAEFMTVLRGVRFGSDDDDPVDEPRRFRIRVVDDNAHGGAFGPLANDPLPVASVAVEPTNDGPALTASPGVTTYGEQARPVAIDSGLLLTDPDGLNGDPRPPGLSATVEIVGGFEAGADVLAYPGVGPFIVVVDGPRLTLTVAPGGDLSLGDFEAALRQVTFFNGSDNPGPSDRVVAFRFSDGEAASPPVEKTVALTPINDRPAADAGAGTATFLEETGAAVAVHPSFTLTDVDGHNGSLESAAFSARVAITRNGEPAFDRLSLPEEEDAAGGIVASGGSGGEALLLRVAGGRSATVADFQAALRAVVYTHPGQDPSGLERRVSTTFNDGIAASREVRRQLAVVIHNDRPVLDLDGAATGIDAPRLDYFEDVDLPLVGAAATLVDPEGDGVSRATVTLGANRDPRDRLAAIPPSPISASFDPATGVLALTGNATGEAYLQALRTVTFANPSDHPGGAPREITFQVRDTNGRRAPNGRRESAPAARLTVGVNPVNDRPVAAAQAVVALEDVEFALALSGGDGEADTAQGLTFVLVTLPATGSLALTSGGAAIAAGELPLALPAPGLFFRTAAGDVTAQEFTFRVVDDGGTANGGEDTSADATVAVEVTPVNDEPVAHPQELSAIEDVELAITLAGDDSDPDAAQALTFLLQSLPPTGTLAENGGGPAITAADLPLALDDPEVFFRSAPGDVSAQSFSFRVKDSGGTANGGGDTSAAAEISISVTPVNDRPAADTQELTALEDVELPIRLTGEDGDPDAEQALTFVLLSLPATGTLSEAGGGPAIVPAELPLALPSDEVFFQTAPGDVSPQAFTFLVVDDGGTAHGGGDTSAEALVTLAITPVNDAPVADPGGVNALEDVELPITLTGDDSDPDAEQALTFVLTSLPATATLSETSGGPPLSAGPLPLDLAGDTVFFRTAPGDVTAQSFSFRVRDDGGRANGGEDTSADAVVAVEVTPVNDPPAANAQSVSALEDVPLPITLTGDDSDPDAVQGLAFVLTSLPSSGKLAQTSGGPAFDPGDLPLVLAGPEVFFLTAPDDVTDQEFTFRVMDDGGTAEGGDDISPDAAVAVEVVPVNDEPSADPLDVSALEDVELAITLTGDDRDAEVEQELTFVLTSLPATGTLAEVAGGNPVTPGDLPLALGGSEVFFRTAAGDVSAQGFTFRVVDDGGTANGGDDTSPDAGVGIEITAVNDRPSADPQARVALEDVDLPVTLTGDDNDPDAEQGLTFILTSLPATGTLAEPGGGAAITAADLPVVLAGAEVVFLTAPDDVSAQSFTFRVMDDGGTADGGEDTSPDAAVAIEVTPVNDTPLAHPQALTAVEDVELPIGLTGDDGDADAEQGLTFVLVSLPAAGTLTATAGGAAITAGELPLALPGAGLFFQTAENDVAPQAFTFRVQDDAGRANDGDDTSPDAVVDLTITPVNDAPAADPQETTALEDVELRIALSGADGDADPEQELTFVLVSLPATAALSTSAGGPAIVPADLPLALAGDELFFTTALNDVAPQSFDFRVRDGDGTANGGEDTSPDAGVTVNVTAVNDVPIAEGQEVTAIEDQELPITLGGGDGDADAEQALTFVLSSLPATGTFSTTSGGVAVRAADLPLDLPGAELFFTTAPDEVAAQSFTFHVRDDGGRDNGGVDTSPDASVEVEVTPVNDQPVADAQDPVALEDQELSITLSGDDGDEDADQALTFVLLSLPESASLSATSGGPPIGAGDLPRVLAGAEVFFRTAPDDVSGQTFTFRAVDDGGRANNGEDTSASATVTLAITPVNDRPTAHPQAVTAVEDVELPIALSGDDGDADAEQALTFILTSLPATGSLSETGGGSAIRPDDLPRELAGTTMFFRTAGNDISAQRFDFQVRDDAGTAEGGLDTSVSATVEVTVTPVNDGPTTAGLPDLAIDEDSPAVTIDLHPAFADVDDADEDLRYTLETVSAPGLFALAEVDEGFGQLRLVVEPDANGPAELTVRATDPGGLFTEAVFQVTVNPVNDPPVISGGSGTLAVGDKSSLRPFPDLQFTEIDRPVQRLVITVTVSPPGAGSLQSSRGFAPLGGGRYRFEGTATEATEAVRELLFLPAENRRPPGEVEPVGLQVGADDGGAEVVIDASTVVEVISQNDPPVPRLAPDRLVAYEGVPTGLATSFYFRDPDPGDPPTYTAIGLPPGLFLDPASGRLEGVPSRDDVGVYTGEITVRDAAGETAAVALPLIVYEGRQSSVIDGAAGPGGLFGWSVDVDGETLVAGAPNDAGGGPFSGAAFVYRRAADPAGSWVLEARLMAAGGGDFDEFGRAVALDGETVVVGARSADLRGEDSGAAYVFRRAGAAGGWLQVAVLSPAEGLPGDQLGHAVAIAGDRIVVGARFAGQGAPGAGATYVFERDAGGAENWGQVARLRAPDPTADALFGGAVALSGDLVAAGASGDKNSARQSGSVYLFHRDRPSAGRWGAVVKLVASEAAGLAGFGQALAFEGRTVAVGARFDDPNGAASGAVYLFGSDSPEDPWEGRGRLTPEGATAGDEFGFALALAGDNLVVGARFNRGGVTPLGSAYLFRRDAGGDTWTEAPRLLAADAGNAEGFGHAVAASGGTIVAGARSAGGVDAPGRTYVFAAPSVTVPEESYDAWRGRVFAGLPQEKTGRADDFSADGISNQLAFAMGLDPRRNNAAARPRVSRPAAAATTMTLVYRRSSQAAGVQFVVEKSGDLGTWTAAANTSRILGEFGDALLVEATTTIPTGTGGCFLRLRVEFD